MRQHVFAPLLPWERTGPRCACQVPPHPCPWCYGPVDHARCSGRMRRPETAIGGPDGHPVWHPAVCTVVHLADRTCRTLCSCGCRNEQLDLFGD